MSKREKKSRFGANVVADVERQKQAAKSYGYLNLPGDIKMFKEKPGKLFLDVIPYIVKDEHHLDGNIDNPDSALPGNPWYKRPIWVHRSVGADNQSVICPKTIGKKCPICEYRDKQFKDGMDRDDVIDKASLRNLYIVVPIGNKDYDEEMHLWDISQFNFQNQLNEEIEEDPDNGVFPDLAHGKTLRIRFSEEQFGGNKFAQASRIDFEERDQQYDEDVIEDAPCLDDVFEVPSYEALKALFFEDEEDDYEEDDHHEPEDKPQRKSKSLRKRDPEPDDKDDFDADRGFDDDQEKEDKKPAKEKRSLRKTTKEPEEEKEDDVDEKPRRGRRSAKKTECPFDHDFGKDWDEHDDCDDCNKKHSNTFDACGSANEKLEK